MSVMNNLFTESNGTKRGLSGIISALGMVLMGIPGLSGVITILSYLGGLVGLGGLSHAGAEGTLTDHKLSSLAAVFSIALAICNMVPALNQYVPIIQEIAGFLGIGVATMSVAKSPF